MGPDRPFRSGGESHGGPAGYTGVVASKPVIDLFVFRRGAGRAGSSRVRLNVIAPGAERPASGQAVRIPLAVRRRGARESQAIQAAGIPYRTLAQWYYAEADLAPGEYDISTEGPAGAGRWRFSVPARADAPLRMFCDHAGPRPSWRDRLTALYPSGEILATSAVAHLAACCRDLVLGYAKTRSPTPVLGIIQALKRPVWMMADGRVHRIRPGEYLLSNPGTQGGYAPRQAFPADARIVVVTAPALSRFRKEAGLPESLGPFGFDPAPRRIFPALASAITRLEEAMRHPDEIGAHLATTSACTALLLRLLQEHPNRLKRAVARDSLPPEPPAGESGEDPRLRRAMEYMARHYAGPCPVEEVARESAASVSVLRRLFRTRLHQSPNDYLQGLRVNRAINLLANRSLTVEQVAQEVGYMDARSFRRVFQKHTRKEIRSFRGKS